MANVFISYNHQVKEITTILANDIDVLGHTVWFDQALSGGREWWDKILASVRSCDVFVLDPMTLNSAAALGRAILPVLFSEGVSTNLLPPALLRIQFVDYRKRDPQTTLRLARAFTNLPPSKTFPDPLPPPPEAPISYLGGPAEQVETSAMLNKQQQTALMFELKT
jgi:hypothetical protein